MISCISALQFLVFVLSIYTSALLIQHNQQNIIPNGIKHELKPDKESRVNPYE